MKRNRLSMFNFFLSLVIFKGKFIAIPDLSMRLLGNRFAN